MDSKLYTFINCSENIAIFSHIAPDADALCGAFAFKNIINNNFDFKNVDVFIDGEIGELYDPILREEKLNPKPFSSYDLAVVLDCPNIQRTGKFADMIRDIPLIVNIDHHESNTRFGIVNYVTSQASSTCELIYLITKGQHLDIDDQIAKELYQGIITDTNCFTSPYSTKRTHQVASELMGYNFDANKIKEYYFRNNSPAKTKLLANALQSMRFYSDDKLTTMKITNDTFSKVRASFEDTLGIIDNGININGTEVSAILIEKMPNQIYCSLRSKGNIDVGKIAREFYGGGSVKLSAFQIEGDIKDIEKRVVDIITPQLDNLPNDESGIIF
ncbi:MAG: bifunctional oligoribonuclease/PAP phosphatase NrnA [Christensenellales bacterium]